MAGDEDETRVAAALIASQHAFVFGLREGRYGGRQGDRLAVPSLGAFALQRGLGEYVDVLDENIFSNEAAGGDDVGSAEHFGLTVKGCFAVANAFEVFGEAGEPFGGVFVARKQERLEQRLALAIVFEPTAIFEPLAESRRFELELEGGGSGGAGVALPAVDAAFFARFGFEIAFDVVGEGGNRFIFGEGIGEEAGEEALVAGETGEGAGERSFYDVFIRYPGGRGEFGVAGEALNEGEFVFCLAEDAEEGGVGGDVVVGAIGTGDLAGGGFDDITKRFGTEFGVELGESEDGAGFERETVEGDVVGFGGAEAGNRKSADGILGEASEFVGAGDECFLGREAGDAAFFDEAEKGVGAEFGGDLVGEGGDLGDGVGGEEDGGKKEGPDSMHRVRVPDIAVGIASSKGHAAG